MDVQPILAAGNVDGSPSSGRVPSVKTGGREDGRPSPDG